MNCLVYNSDSEAATEALGIALARLLPDGTVVALNGPLGAGKTRLVQALAAASGVDPRDCVSPTFVLIHEYHGRRTIYHFDVYRILDDDEFLQLGPEEYFHAQEPALVVVEWAERVERCLPPQRVEIRIEPTGESVRCITIAAHGKSYRPVIEQLHTWAANQ